MGKGTFVEHTRAIVSFDTIPSTNDKVWMDQTSGIIYNLDESRGVWMSAAKHTFEFARKGAASGMYLPLLGDLDAIDDVYTPGKDAVIIALYCKSRGGNENKDFELRKNGNSLLDFSYNNNLEYVNDSLNFNIESNDEIQVFVLGQGISVRNTICRVEIAWRYDV